MGIFSRKKRSDVIDLTDMQRRGLLPKTSIPQPRIKSDNQGYADLTLGHDTPAQNPSQTTQRPPEGSESAGSWFGGFFANSDTSTKTESAGQSYASETSDRTWTKNKIEDIEFKIDAMNKKLNRLMDRMEVAEKRLDRIEGRNY